LEHVADASKVVAGIVVVDNGAAASPSAVGPAWVHASAWVGSIVEVDVVATSVVDCSFPCPYSYSCQPVAVACMETGRKKGWMGVAGRMSQKGNAAVAAADVAHAGAVCYSLPWR